MDLLQLRYFQTVAEYLHVTQAAEKLQITQPALSQMIGRLENELGVPLFERKGRNVVLNAYGERLLHQVNAVLRIVDEIQTDFSRLRETYRNQLAIASSFSLYFSSWLKEYAKCHAEIIIQKHILTVPQIMKELSAGRIDFALMPATPAFDKELESIVLCEDEYIVIMNKNHPLAGNESIKIFDIINEPIICRSQTAGFLRITDEIFAQVGCVPNIIFEGDTESMVDMLELNKGITFSTKSFLRKPLISENISLTFLKIDQLNSKKLLSLYWLKVRKLTKIDHNFVNFLIKHYQDNPFDDLWTLIQESKKPFDVLRSDHI